MIQNLRQIKSRIRGIENTRKITRAMEMVSSAKLSRVKSAMLSNRAYLSGIEGILNDSVTAEYASTHPLLAKKERVKTLVLCVISADTGLCGPYNQNIIRHAERFVSLERDKYVKLVTVGREAYNYFSRRGFHVAHRYSGLNGRFSAVVSDELSSDIVKMYQNGEADEIHIAHTRFSVKLRHAPVIEKFLNMEIRGVGHMDYIYEPGQEEILSSIIPKYISLRMRAIILEAFTSEHSSRMLAMKTATDNADDLIDTLTLLRNKARQSAITKEVLEIALSAEALKG